MQFLHGEDQRQFGQTGEQEEPVPKKIVIAKKELIDLYPSPPGFHWKTELELNNSSSKSSQIIRLHTRKIYTGYGTVTGVKCGMTSFKLCRW